MPDEERPPEQQPEESQAEPLDVAQVERWLSRAVAVVGVATLGIAALIAQPGHAPIWAPLALVAVFGAVKVVVLVIGIRQRWPAWPAVAGDIAAVALLGYMVKSNNMSTAAVLAIVFLLMVSRYWRRRALQDAPVEGP